MIYAGKALNPDERLVLLKALSVMRQAKLAEADDCTEALNKLVHHYRQIVDSGRELTQEEKQFLFEAKELLPLTSRFCVGCIRCVIGFFA